MKGTKKSHISPPLATPIGDGRLGSYYGRIHRRLHVLGEVKSLTDCATKVTGVCIYVGIT